MFASKRRKQYNLSKEEAEALDWLSNNDDFIIKRVDKGGAVVVWGRDQYIEEALLQLRNCELNQPLKSDLTKRIRIELTYILTHSNTEGWISQNVYDFLFCKEPRIPTCYMLPKIHNNLESPPGRPIISGNGSITEPASKFVDYFIKPMVSELASYIQDTTPVLNIIKNIKNTETSILATIVVESLYNIDHEEGLEALSHYLEIRSHLEKLPASFILQLAERTLKNNVFFVSRSAI